MLKSVALGNKLCKLKGIMENKDILFGCFSDRLTKKDKISCWKGVHEKRASLLGLDSHRQGQQEVALVLGQSF